MSIRIDHDVIDRLYQDVMRGFGSAPRRGVEVGGLLLGTAEAGEELIAHVVDFEPVPSEHARGPSYLLSPKDRQTFEAALDRWQPQDGRRTYAIGFYRSHTREGLSLAQEDVELLSEYFPEASGLVLLVKPYATRVSTAGFFFREEGTIRMESPYLEFPFRRRELGGESETAEQVEHSSFYEGAPPPAEEAEDGHAPGRWYPAEAGAQGVGAVGQAGEPAGPSRAGRRSRPSWVWIPLSFVFLLLGTVLGFQVALSVRSQLPAGAREDPYALSLSATPSADSLHVRWDRRAPAIQGARYGVLIITEGGRQKTVDLDTTQLQNGSVIYRRTSNDVHFRLEVFAKEWVSVSETLHFKLEAPAADLKQ